MHNAMRLARVTAARDPDKRKEHFSLQFASRCQALFITWLSVVEGTATRGGENAEEENARDTINTLVQQMIAQYIQAIVL